MRPLLLVAGAVLLAFTALLVHAEERPGPGLIVATPTLAPTPTPVPAYEATAEELLRLRDSYVIRFKESWEKPENLLEIYADEGRFVRTFIKDGKEMRRNVYTSGTELFNKVKRTPNIKRDNVDIDIYDIRGFADEDEGYLVFRQDFTTRDSKGRITYQDTVIKTIRQVKDENGEWKVVYENSTVYDPDNYLNDLDSIVADFLKDVDANPEVQLKPILELTPTPLPTFTPIPSPTPYPEGKFFRVVHEVTYEPIPDVRVDIVDINDNLLDTVFTNEDGMTAFPYNATPSFFLTHFLYFNKYGYEEVYRYYVEWTEEEEPFVTIILPMRKPLIIPDEHIVEADENLQEIADYYYGSPEYWRELLFVNNGITVRDAELPLGAILFLPTIEELRSIRQEGFELYYQADNFPTVEKVAAKFFVDPNEALSVRGSSVQNVDDLAMASNVTLPGYVTVEDLFFVVVAPDYDL